MIDYKDKRGARYPFGFNLSGHNVPFYYLEDVHFPSPLFAFNKEKKRTKETAFAISKNSRAACIFFSLARGVGGWS